MNTGVNATSTGEQVVFWFCAILAVAGALGMLFSRKAVHSALWLAMTMINLAILYVALQAPFLGMAQIIVYTGAIMMLFLFVLMIVGVDSSDSLVETIAGQRVLALLFGIGFGILLFAVVGRGLIGLPTGSLTVANAVRGGNVQGIAELVFTRYVFAFEATSALLISAALGAMVLTHRERTEPRKTQRDLSVARFQVGGDPNPLPPPGVYAWHNAVDIPALLPDGTQAEISVPRPLAARGPRQVEPDEVAEVHELTDGHDVVVGEIGHAPGDEGRE